MALIKGHTNDDWRSKRSQEQLALGGLPLNAEWRLRTLREKKLFTSNLSVSEFALTRAERITVLGQVTGCCTYHVGWQPGAVQNSMELSQITRAHNQAWRLALSRLQAEAKALDAHGVIGVHLRAKPVTWQDTLLEVSVQGTAIRWQGAPVTASPFISAVSGQEFWALLSAGYRPVGVAFGTCVYQQVTTIKTRQATGSGVFSSAARSNQELREYTLGFYKARRRAVQHMENEAMLLNAAGIVGVNIEKEFALHEVEVELGEDAGKQKREDLIVRFFALGTAIAPFTEYRPSIYPVMPLTP